MTDQKPTIGIKPWGNPQPKKRQFPDDDVPRLPYKNLKNGLNNVRILTGFGVYYQARYKNPANGKPFGVRVRTAWPSYDDCPVKNDLGLTPRERYKAVVLDRDYNPQNEDDSILKLLDMSVLVQEQVETILEVKNQRRPEGSKVTPRDFDVSIKFNPKADNISGFYGVVGDDVMPLTDEDLAAINDIGGYEMLDKILQKQLFCPKRETVVKRLKQLGWDGQPVVKKDEAAAKENSTETLEEASEDDYSFHRPSDAEDDESASAAAVNE